MVEWILETLSYYTYNSETSLLTDYVAKMIYAAWTGDSKILDLIHLVKPVDVPPPGVTLHDYLYQVMDSTVNFSTKHGYEKLLKMFGIKKAKNYLLFKKLFKEMMNLLWLPLYIDKYGREWPEAFVSLTLLYHTLSHVFKAEFLQSFICLLVTEDYSGYA
jgi:hypothetical protein